MNGGETRDCEACLDIGGQPTDDDPAAAPRFSDGHGREVRMAAVQDEDSAPRGGDNPVDRRGEGGGQLGQRRVADVDAGATTVEAVRQRQEHPP